ASKPPLVVAPLSARRDQVQLATLNPGGVHVGTMVDDPTAPERVAYFRAMVNAELGKEIWEVIPDLLDDYDALLIPVDRLTGEKAGLVVGLSNPPRAKKE